MLDPLTSVLSTLLSAVHHLVTDLGAPPGGVVAWCLSIAAIVVVVRGALLPITVHQVRNARRAAVARPHLQALAQRYAGRTDPESLRAMMAERRQLSAEHGVSRLGCLPVLLQIPIWIALYHVISDEAVGSLAVRGLLGHGVEHVLVVIALGGLAAAISYVTQRCFVLPNTTTDGMPEAVQRATRMMPTLSALGLLATAAIAPVGLLVYWLCSQLWTLGQQLVVWRWFPTRGTPAAERWDQART